MERPSDHPEPTEADRENERIRMEVAERMAEAYGRVVRLAMGLFGPGWLPSHRHFLTDREEERKLRHTGERPREVATVYTVKNADGDQRHFMVGEDGKTREVSGYAEGFGAMLHEKHPTEGFMHKGEFVHTGRFSLCWSSIETYSPMSAAGLAKLRQSRERGREERADAKFAAENPLLAQAGITRKDLE